jgi:hypothetical protein
MAAAMGDLRQGGSVQVLFLCVLTGGAVGLFSAHHLDYVFWAIAGLAAVVLVAWLWPRFQRQQRDRKQVTRGWRD